VPVAVLTTGVLNGQHVTQVAAGRAHTCVVAGGKAYCWGINGNGQVGNNTTTSSTVAVAVTSLPWATGATLTSLSAGMNSTCVLATGKAYCWGSGGNGQLGNGGSSDQKTPVAVTATGVPSGTFDQISAGANHTCAVSSKVAHCWGQNSEGRLGTGTTTASTVPATVETVSGPPCPTGAGLITPTTCSLASGTTYYYQLTYTIDGGMSLTSGWIDLKTS
jgi:alpha-tubulin suppressor-like RCC1 family protein